MSSEQFVAFIWATLVFLATSYVTYFLCGKAVRRYNIRIAYSRKVMHVVTFALPWTLQQAFGLANCLPAAAAAACLVPFHFLIFAEPIRRRSTIVATMFLGLERPEDRPYTLWWMTSQFAATYAVYAALYAGMIVRGITAWMILPLLVMALGDGLAEPVGVTFGRHSYETVALNGGQRYRRTLEGSACVFVTAVVVLGIMHLWFTPMQFIAALVLIPITATVMEAVSPHTWDAPIMLMAMGLQLLAITYI